MPSISPADARTRIIDALLHAHFKVMHEAFLSLSVLSPEDPLRPVVEASRQSAEIQAIDLLRTIQDDHQFTQTQVADAIGAGSLELLAAFPTPAQRRCVNLEFHLTPLFAALGPAYAERVLEIAILDSNIFAAVLPLSQAHPEWRPLLAQLCKSQIVLSELTQSWRGLGLLHHLPERLKAWPDVLPRVMKLQLEKGLQPQDALFGAIIEWETDAKVRIEKVRKLRGCGAHIDEKAPYFKRAFSHLGSNHQRIVLYDTCRETQRLASKPLGGSHDPIQA